MYLRMGSRQATTIELWQLNTLCYVMAVSGASLTLRMARNCCEKRLIIPYAVQNKAARTDWNAHHAHSLIGRNAMHVQTRRSVTFGATPIQYAQSGPAPF